MTSGPHLLLCSSIETHHLNGVLATLSWLRLSPSHRNDRIRHDIVLVTVSTFLSCYLSQLQTPNGWLWSQWPPQCGATWSVLSVIFHISQESQSLARGHFCSDLMMARSWPRMSWLMSLILFIWPSIQSLPLLSLQDALTLFLYFFQVVHTDTSSVFEQERQSPEAVSKSESAMFPLDEPESEDVWSLVLFELPAAASSSGLARALMGPEGGLEDSCLHCPELVLGSGINSGM